MNALEQALYNKGYRLNERGEWYLPNGVRSRMVVDEVIPAKRIRQGKETLNKLEKEWMSILLQSHSPQTVRAQSMRFRLANGLWYKPDFVVFESEHTPVCYEVKGPHAFRGGFENLKMAATAWPLFDWMLVWKRDGQWCQQLVLSGLIYAPDTLENALQPMIKEP